MPIGVAIIMQRYQIGNHALSLSPFPADIKVYSNILFGYNLDCDGSKRRLHGGITWSNEELNSLVPIRRLCMHAGICVNILTVNQSLKASIMPMYFPDQRIAE